MNPQELNVEAQASKEKMSASLQVLLKEDLGRDPAPHEVVNAETDTGLLVRVLLLEIQNIKILLAKNGII